MFEGTGSDQPSGVRRFIWLAVGCLLVGGVVLGAMIGLVTDEDKWGWGFVLFLGVLAAFSLVRNLLGRTPSPSEEPDPIRWWHQALALAALFVVFMVKGLSTLGLSIAEAATTAGIATAVLGVVAAGVLLYERRHGS